MSLSQILETVPSIEMVKEKGLENAYLDLISLELAIGNPGGLPNTNIGNDIRFPKGQPNMVIIPYGNQIGQGDIHDTFKYDRYGNTYNGHTTIRMPNNQNNHQGW